MHNIRLTTLMTVFRFLNINFISVPQHFLYSAVICFLVKVIGVVAVPVSLKAL